MNVKDHRRLLRLIFLALSLLLMLAVVLTSGSGSKTARHSEMIPLSEEVETDLLKPGMRWAGLMTITSHKGEGVLENGMRKIRGYLGKTEDRCYFELFNRGDPDTAEPLLSLWVSLDGDTMHPLIGEDDAWYFDIWLDDRDLEPFTLRLENGELRQSYFYDSGDETCWIEFHIKSEKRA